MKKDQKQKESQDNGNLKNLRHQLWLPNFMETFGDV